MKRSLAFSVFIIFILAYGIFLNRYSLIIFPEILIPKDPVGFNDYKGVINIHSTQSTGSLSKKEIALAAKELGLDFLIFTELNPFESEVRKPFYSDEVLVAQGSEFSYRNSRILNIAGDPGVQFSNAAQAQMLIDDKLSKPIDTNDGLFVIAHPFKEKYKWKGEVSQGIHGIEVINLRKIWQQAWLENKISFLWTLFTYLFNDRMALVRLFENQDEEIQFWDANNKVDRKFIAFANADARSKIKVSGGTHLKFPSYKTLLGIVSNHVLIEGELTGDAQKDYLKIQQALLAGQFYMSLDTLADPKGFNATIQTSNGKVYPMGSELTHKDGMELVIRLPQKPNVPFDVIIFRNGERVFTSNSQVTKWVIHEPGVYRVKVRVIPTFPLPDGKKWIPWLYTNAFYVSD